MWKATGNSVKYNYIQLNNDMFTHVEYEYLLHVIAILHLKNILKTEFLVLTILLISECFDVITKTERSTNLFIREQHF